MKCKYRALFEATKNFTISLLSLFWTGCDLGNQPLDSMLTPKKSVDLAKLHVFLAPHPDDWQIFMGHFAYDVITSKATQALIILVTAGDHGNDDAYWQAREAGSIASVRAAYKLDLWTASPQEVSSTTLVNGKNLSSVKIENTTMVFFRLPDGFLKGAGSATHSSQSLAKLFTGDIPSLTSVDGANSFTKQDLQATLLDLVHATKAKDTQEVFFHTLDSGYGAKMAHSDHYYATEFLMNIRKEVQPGCNINAYQDYRSQYRPANLSNTEAGKKVELFSAYDQIMIQSGQECGMCSASHYKWLMRSYFVQISCAG